MILDFLSAAGENFWDFRVLKSSFLRENQYTTVPNTEIFACGAIWISPLKSQEGAKQGGFLQVIGLMGDNWNIYPLDLTTMDISFNR